MLNNVRRNEAYPAQVVHKDTKSKPLLVRLDLGWDVGGVGLEGYNSHSQVGDRHHGAQEVLFPAVAQQLDVSKYCGYLGLELFLVPG